MELDGERVPPQVRAQYDARTGRSATDGDDAEATCWFPFVSRCTTTSFYDPRNGSTFAKYLADIDGNCCGPDGIAYVGKLLWASVFNGPVVDAFWESYHAFMKRPQEAEVTRLVRLRLALPPELRDLPWESLYVDDLGGGLTGKPGFIIVRDPPPDTFFQQIAPTEDLRLLLAVPQGSGLNSQQERNSLQRYSRDKATVDDFVGQVTPDDLARKLQDRWDIFHFVGHGALDKTGHVKVLLSGEAGGDTWLRDEIVANLFTRKDLRLAVLNCCMGDRPRPGRSLSGLGPLLQQRGIPAVVAMRYEISDDDAITFSEAFYRELLDGPLPGQVDLAVSAALAALARNAAEDGQRAVITPVLYLAPGFERLFHLEPKAAEETRQPGPNIRVPATAAQLPADVIRAIQEECCVPVVGPAALGWTRDNALTPLVFARKLAQDAACTYPLLRPDLDLCERAGEWMNGNFLQWVCQHREAQNETRSELVEFVQAHYAKAEPPPLLEALKSWKVPALFYTYFDGFLEGEVTRGAAWLNRVVYDLDKSLESTSPSLEGQRFLVLLRGSHRRGKSLVLTESDHDILFERIRNISSQLAEFTLKEKRLTLFLGVSPRDPLIRQLSRQLLATEQRLHRPPYFVWKGWTAVDRAYWQRFGVRPIDEDASTVVRLISRAMS